MFAGMCVDCLVRHYIKVCFHTRLEVIGLVSQADKEMAFGTESVGFVGMPELPLLLRGEGAVERASANIDSASLSSFSGVRRGPVIAVTAPGIHVRIMVAPARVFPPGPPPVTV